MIEMSGGPPDRTFVGGLWSETMSAIWPLVRLELFGWGIGLRASTRGLGWLIPAWTARYEELTGAQLVRVPVASRGVCFHTVTAAGLIVFWSRRGTDILDHLQVHGVPVDRSVSQLSWGAHLHHP
jgi:hypothetical protein